MRAILLALLVATLAAQEPEPYPGQGHHAKPPDGWYCHHQNYELSVPPAHVCACERMQREDGTIAEDEHCSVYCWPAFCRCRLTGDRR